MVKVSIPVSERLEVDESTDLGIVRSTVPLVVHVEGTCTDSKVRSAQQVLSASILELLLVSVYKAVRELVQLVLY